MRAVARLVQSKSQFGNYYQTRIRYMIVKVEEVGESYTYGRAFRV